MDSRPRPLTLDDGAGSAGLKRLRLIGQLAGVKKQLGALGEGKASALKRLQLVAQANQIRIQLGARPGEVEVKDDPNLTILREVTSGRHDALGLAGLLDKIRAAAIALFEKGILTGQAEAAAHAAISRWAALELKTNG